jgi:glycosyltransferase involved in cell wall biosynthesis
MTIGILHPTLPPYLDGIAAYTARQSAELARLGETVRVLVRSGHYDSIPGVAITPCFEGGGRSLLGALPAIATAQLDWLLIQYNPSTYRGRSVINPFLPYLTYRIRRVSPQTRIGLVLHETFAPATPEFWLRARWERMQLFLMGRCADLLVLAASNWERRLDGWFPDVPSLHLPVGSNVPRQPVDRQVARNVLGLDDGTVVLGLFGGLDRFKLPVFYRAVAQKMDASGLPHVFVYVGTSGDEARALFGSAPLIDCGPLPDADVAARFAAFDIYLTPFANGVTTRRGSFIAGLHHGLPTVTTLGPASDPLLRDAAGTAFLAASDDAPSDYADVVVALATDAARRRALRQRGEALYRRVFDWSVTVPRLRDAMRDLAGFSPSRTPSTSSPLPLPTLSN